jgi:hypothetical protein
VAGWRGPRGLPARRQRAGQALRQLRRARIQRLRLGDVRPLRTGWPSRSTATAFRGARGPGIRYAWK